MKRRQFINHLGMGAATTMLPYTLLSCMSSNKGSSKKTTFGIVTDVHKDLMPDANERLETFIEEAQKRNVDFIIQMGDFCFGETKNKSFLNIWERFKGPKYHILGNHDMDRDSKPEIMDFWGMQKPYYAFDFNGFHFVVLDANFLYHDGSFIDYKNANFYVDSSLRAFVNDEQIEWFKADLEATQLPTLVFSHQSLWHDVNNRVVLQGIMETQAHKVICALNGHDHTDCHHKKNNIDYIGINSMSYQWFQEYTSTERFSKALYEQYGNLHHLAGYVDPLYAFATIDPEGVFKIEGVKSEWMPPSPYSLGAMPNKNDENAPKISDFKVPF